jgi:hypothetical protein
MVLKLLDALQMLRLPSPKVLLVLVSGHLVPFNRRLFRPVGFRPPVKPVLGSEQSNLFDCESRQITERNILPNGIVKDGSNSSVNGPPPRITFEVDGFPIVAFEQSNHTSHYTPDV